jgi:hypothetical protein
MPIGLQLHVTDFKDESRWRWELRDEKGIFLSDHEVKLERSSSEWRGFSDLPGYLKNRPPDTPAEESLQRVGSWMGREVFGAVLPKIGERLDFPATVRVHVPEKARVLPQRPFELAHLDGKPLAEAGVRFVYQRADAAEPKGDKPASDRRRVLAVFSLPHGQHPLNLRRERMDLERFLKNLAQTRSATVELRVLQYGATLKDAPHSINISPCSGYGDFKKPAR